MSDDRMILTADPAPSVATAVMPPRADDARRKADYGIDAPGVVRNLFLASAGGFVIWLIGLMEIAPGRGWAAAMEWAGMSCGIYFAALGAFMIYASRVGKLRERDRLLRLIHWTGRETVLDVGCGRGLMLIGAARQLSAGGRAIGIDIWQSQDQSGNRPDVTLENARRDGVADRVEIRTADMRRLPFADASADVIVSHWAVHNLYDLPSRATALAEMARVLKPGGQIVLSDIAHHREYAAALRANGLTDIRRAGSRAAAVILGALTMGSFAPATVVAVKPRLSNRVGS